MTNSKSDSPNQIHVLYGFNKQHKFSREYEPQKEESQFIFRLQDSYQPGMLIRVLLCKP